MCDTSELVIAVDVGGTRIKAALFAGSAVIDSFQLPTGNSSTAALETIFEAIDQLYQLAPTTGGRQIKAIGLVVPGIVADESGIVVRAENLGWYDLELKSLVAERYQLPVGFGHDVRAGALAEYQLGAGRGAETMVFIAVGTGIAATVIHRGIVFGAGAAAGEIGHGGSVVGEQCPCGGRGCLETFASAAAIARRYAAATQTPVAGAVEVLQAVAAGDLQAKQIWDEAIVGLADQISQIVRLLGQIRIVIGGGLSLAGPALFPSLIAATADRLTVQPMPQILPSAFTDRSAVHGAALLARQAATAT